MHLKFLFSLLPLFAAATAVAEGGYVVPEDTAPGFYVVDFHADGTTTTERVDVDAVTATANPPEKRSLLSPNSAKFPRHLAKRVTWGGTGRFMTEQDQYNGLTVNWRNYFNRGASVGGRRIWYFASDRLVLALCVYQNQETWLPGVAVDEFNGLLDEQLGFWQTGWAHFGDFYGDLSFWRDYRGIRICDNLNGGIVAK